MGTQLIRRLLPILVCTFVFLPSGCDSSRKKASGDYLLRIGELTVTRTDYEEALEVAKSAYPYEALREEETLKGIKSRLLKQLTEELIIAKRARELGLWVSEAEIQEAIAAIKADYPPRAFEEALFENAVSFAVWKKRLKARLLTEKVIRKELMENVEVSPAAVRDYYARHYQEAAGNEQPDTSQNLMIVKRLRREQARREYPDWIKNIQRSYPVELNTHMWERILQQS